MDKDLSDLQLILFLVRRAHLPFVINKGSNKYLIEIKSSKDIRDKNTVPVFSFDSDDNLTAIYCVKLGVK